MAYESSLESTAATFNSPSMAQGETGILCQWNPGGGVIGVPTWDGNAMTEVLQLDAAGSSCGIWYITAPTVGVTTIARGSGADYCVAIKASDVAGGVVSGDTDTAGGGGLGGALMFLDAVIPVDLLVAVLSVDDGTVGVSYDGVGSVKEGATVGGYIQSVATAEGQSGNNVDVSWDYGTTGNTSAVACVFHGRSRKSNVVALL